MNIMDYDLYVTLVHHPIKNKDGEIVTTAVTNMDVHDIARLSATFGFKAYYVVTPISEQKALVARIIEHWKGTYGRLRNNNRSAALNFVEISSSLEDVVLDIEQKTGKKVKIIATSAKQNDRNISISNFASKELNKNNAYLLMFGTGWGLADNVMNKADYVFEPLSYETNYNHLSVRSAVSIIMDRLYNAIGRSL